MPGDIVMVGHTEDGTTVVMLFYDYRARKMRVVVVHGDPEMGAYDEDTERGFVSDSRAKAEDHAIAVCREYDIPAMDEMIIDIMMMPESREELNSWVNPGLPYLN